MGEEWKYASLASNIGKWAWIIGIINGVLGIIWFIYGISTYLYWLGILGPLYVSLSFSYTWNLITAIIIIAISFLIIKPKFSSKCAAMDWDSLYDWVLTLGSFRLPWMLVWGIILEIFGWYGWGGIAILIPALLLLFVGPKEFQWSTETKPIKKQPAKKKPAKKQPAKAKPTEEKPAEE
ncbi:MAG: hypothetical protein ACFFD5_10345 [Candidatus Thorarchaeota archaeon]